MFNITKNILDLIPDGGRIINMSAVAGISGNIGQTNYSAAKAGIIGFTKSLAKELGKRKITVNVVAPGLIKSEMTDKIPPQILANMLQLVALKEMGAAEDVAAAVEFLASDKARYITGTVLRVDGGIFV
jgi:3-oxoacyl-[acyl-carrier protein] reductase